MEFSWMPVEVLGGDGKLRFWTILGNTYKSVDFWRPDILESILSQSQDGTCLPSRGTGSWHLGWVPTSLGEIGPRRSLVLVLQAPRDEARSLRPQRPCVSPLSASAPFSVLPVFSVCFPQTFSWESSATWPGVTAASCMLTPWPLSPLLVGCKLSCFPSSSLLPGYHFACSRRAPVV